MIKKLRYAMTAKETARAVLDRLPEDCSLDDVLYHLYVAQAVQKGRADADAGRTIPHEQVATDLRRRWALGQPGQTPRVDRQRMADLVKHAGTCPNLLTTAELRKERWRR